MALTAVLTDHARALQTNVAPQKVEGKSLMTRAVPTPWFKARLDSGTAAETPDESATNRVLSQRTLLFGIRDLEGNSLLDTDHTCTIKARDRIEVHSTRLGDGIYEITGEPTALTRKRRVLGFEVTLQRVDPEGFEHKVL